jgi:hypothetical protein
MEVWDIRDGCKLIETAQFSISSLTSISLRIDGRKIRSYEGCFRAYKGKLFLLVSVHPQLLPEIRPRADCTQGRQRNNRRHPSVLDRSYFKPRLAWRLVGSDQPRHILPSQHSTG